MRFGFFGLSLLGLAAAAPSAEPGLKIIARETLPALAIETTEYIESDRARVESLVTPASSPAATSPLVRNRQAHRSAQITRCDLHKSILLNYEDRTYMTSPLWMYPSRAQAFLASLASRRPPQPTSPNLAIETTTNQTGERKTAFGYAARRVIITRRQIPLAAAGGAPSENETDGWYIDLETQPSCERLEANGVHAVLVAGNAPSDAAGLPSIPSVTFKDIGAPERGYPIELKTTWRSIDHTWMTHKVVTQLSRERLDPALFEIPPGFHAAEGPLAAVAAQWNRAWQTMKGLIAAFFR